ncbi:MAG: SDR family oxidoreductase [Chlamydiia bacterium]
MSGILLTGATGYVGGRLLKKLLAEGHKVRVFARDPRRVPIAQHPQLEIMQGDAQDPGAFLQAMEGIDVAYYLIHGMEGSQVGFVDREVAAAHHFARACQQRGVQRIIYLGGLGHEGPELSAHLRARHLTGELLRATGVPVTEFRAAVIIGSGSVSFEMIRYLTERLPVMICPRWVQTRCQPIGIGDVLRYLTEALTQPASTGKIIEIGGADVMTYGQMMQRYAQIRGLRRYLIPVPLLTPYLSGLWIGLVTPIPSTIARFLIEGLRNEVVVESPLAKEIFPFQPMGFDEAVRIALERMQQGSVETTWSGSSAVFGLPADPKGLSPELEQSEGMIMERRSAEINAPISVVWRVISRLGGQEGWPYAQRLWALRGLFDRLIGGVGMRRGRRSPVDLREGDVVDFWRVEACLPEHLLRLRAEMKLPGRGWLQFQLVPLPSGKTECVQTCFFEPKGLWGQLYWSLLFPFHKCIFSGMLQKIQSKAEQQAKEA